MITLNACPVCESSNLRQYPQPIIETPDISYQIVSGVSVNVVVISRYSTCQSCQLIFQNPRLSAPELKKYYNQGFYRSLLNSTTEQTDRNELNRAQLDAEKIRQHTGVLESHLDIGCSRGYLLEAVGAKLKVGVESNIAYVKSRGLKIYPELSKVGRKSFDLVSAIHVLEHVPNPLKFLQSMSKLIKKGGYLVVEVPTWKSPGGSLRFVHLSHFEPDVLVNMIKYIGLSIEDIQFTPHLLLICRKKV
jgi:SAM-dependent methyltransferase